LCFLRAPLSPSVTVSVVALSNLNEVFVFVVAEAGNGNVHDAPLDPSGRAILFFPTCQPNVPTPRANPMCRVGRVDRVDRVDRVGRFGRVGSVRANVQANVPTPPSNPTAHPTYCSFFKRQCPSVRLG